MNPWVRRFLVVLGIIGLFIGLFWCSVLLLAPVSDSDKRVRVEIPVGATAGTIAERLRKAGLIRSTLAFQFAARLYGESRNMKAGEYLIPRNLGVVEIIDKLVSGDAESQWVVIQEGKSVRQIAGILASQRLASSNEFMRAASRRPSRYGVPYPVPRASVEGYLMPDTYRFPRQIGERQLIGEMVKNWNRKVYQPNRQLFAASDFPPDKIVVIASMIEREARVPEDRPLISAVIRNRLKKKMLLQIDATVIYALGYHKNELSLKDLKKDSKYNTYRYPGLPAGPICNPGLTSIQAALRPAKADFLYYVAQPDGKHIFTRSFAEHKAAIARVKEMREAAVAAAGK